MKRLELTISGRVQGVNFRRHTQTEAASLGLSGEVWNNDDTTVGVIAEGPLERLQQLLEWTEEGPDQVKVDGVHAVWAEATGEFDTFEIRR